MSRAINDRVDNYEYLLLDDRVSYFLSELARGQHSINYRLRAETPGRMSALLSEREQPTLLFGH